MNYNDFEKRLLNILFLSRDKYFNKISDKKNYLITFNKKLTTIELLIQQINMFERSFRDVKEK